MTDYRKLYRSAAAILVRLDDAGALNYGCVTDDDMAIIGQVRAIPKPGSGKPGRRSPGSGRKKAAKAKIPIDDSL